MNENAIIYIPHWPLHLDGWNHAVDQELTVNVSVHDFYVHGQISAFMSTLAVSFIDVILHERPSFRQTCTFCGNQTWQE